MHHPLILTQKQIDRFHASFERGDDCWLWTGAKNPGGYGVIRKSPGRKLLAHRISYLLNTGDPGTLMVCHHCDVRACVNPAHLFLGTAADNNADARRKGRLTNRGEANGHAKLKAAHILAIRSSPEPHAAVAKQFGLTRRYVAAIRARCAWSHI